MVLGQGKGMIDADEVSEKSTVPCQVEDVILWNSLGKDGVEGERSLHWTCGDGDRNQRFLT
jgi:hypothetical protein